MSCSRYRQLISRYVDDEVTPRQRAELLAHVQTCHECAAWLARARQTDVLLKGVGETRPSDRVRDAILSQVRSSSHKRDEQPPARSAPTFDPRPTPALHIGSLRLGTAGLLLRFNPSPWRVGAGLAASMLAIIGLAYYMNILPPIWGYDKLGFEYEQDSAQALIGTTPIPLKALSSGPGGIGGPVAVPNLVSILPAANSNGVALDAPMRVRFDQPMDRASVESAFSIDPPAAGTFAWDADNEVRFTPDAPGLLRGLTYTVTLSSSAVSMAGTPLYEAVTWSFGTKPAHSVVPGLPSGASVAPTTIFTLLFDGPMQQDNVAQMVSLQEVGSTTRVPVSYRWDTSAKSLAVTPKSALADGYYYLLVQATAATADGDTLGTPFQFEYHVQSPSPRLRLLGDRVLLANQGSTALLQYALQGSDAATLDGVTLDLYALPAEWLSSLSAQANQSGVLPDGVLQASQLVRQIEPVSAQSSGSVSINNLSAGLYLVLAGAPPPGAVAGDWKLLIVSNGALALTGTNSPIWATDSTGRAWVGAEISLYSPAGNLLEKGPADDAGLWQPTAASNGASLGLARDPWGNLAASLVEPGTLSGQSTQKSLPADLVTDMPEYHPGGTINFRVQIAQQQANLTGQNVLVSLLTPAGSPVQALSLKPDQAGGVSGLFVLSPDAAVGTYTIKALSGGLTHDFPVAVKVSQPDTLSVFVLPESNAEEDAQPTPQSITRTVSVLGPVGIPSAGAIVTATLSIRGDSWTSDPVSTTADGNGRATFVVPLPGWFSSYNDPGLYMAVEARSGTLQGSDRSYLDWTSQQALSVGMTQLVSPDMNVAVVARPSADGEISVRVVLVDQQSPRGDILLRAVSPDGEQFGYSLDMARKPDATVDLPQRFAGGTLSVMTAGKADIRTLPIMPEQSPSATLRVTAPLTVTAGTALPVQLVLTGTDGLGMQGVASLWLRRVSGETPSLPPAWQPGVSLDVSGTLATTMPAPSVPGLWYLMAKAATPSGSETASWAVVRVLPGLWVQLPPKSQVTSQGTQNLAVTAYNFTDGPVSDALRADAEGGAQISDSGIQSLDLDAGGSTQLSWSVQPGGDNDSRILFSFEQASSSAGSWVLHLPTQPSSSTNSTYTAGVISGERNVGVSVPWGLSGDNVKLEIRASTSLLPALAESAIDLQSDAVLPIDGVSTVAARLSAPAAVAAAYRRLSANAPDGLQLSSVDYSLLLQQIYSSQHADGGWGYTLDGLGAGSSHKTAEILLALYRSQASRSGDSSLPTADPTIVGHALDYLSDQLARPASANQTTDALDARAYSLYVLSLYRTVPLELVRPMLAYASPELGARGLSKDGEAWLALALWQEGNSSDAIALLNHLLGDGQNASVTASAPVLEALVVAQQSLPTGGYGARTSPDYSGEARLYVAALMEARQGAGWQTPSATADALWALSRYAVATGENPPTSPIQPVLLLGDRQVQADSFAGNPGTVSVVLSGTELKPGTNWLKLKASDSSQTLYYSLTLTATK